MIKETQYINIREVLSRILRHPLLQDVNLEQVTQYTLDFIGIFGLPELYQDKEVKLHIEEFRAMLPCDCVSINLIKDDKTKTIFRSMTDVFMPTDEKDWITGIRVPKALTYKTQGQILYTSMKEGDIIVSYKAIPIDEEGLPLLMDNSVFLKALETYIKKEVFTILFDMGKINPQVLQNTQKQYAWLAGQLQSELSIPSMAELESIKNSWCTLIQRSSEFNKGFANLGNREYIKLQ